MDTCYAPVRRSPSDLASQIHAAPRLACVKPVASVHPEPGSNSSLYNSIVSMTLVPDCSISILTDIDGSLRVRLPIKRQHSLPFHIKRSLVLVSCTTISVYVNLSKNLLPKERIRVSTSQKRGSLLICGCKGTTIPETGKPFRIFFQNIMHLL